MRSTKAPVVDVQKLRERIVVAAVELWQQDNTLGDVSIAAIGRRIFGGKFDNHEALQERISTVVEGLRNDGVLDEGLSTMGGLDYLRVRPNGLSLSLYNEHTRPWYQKAFNWFKGDVRAILVALVTTLLTVLMLKLLGWN